MSSQVPKCSMVWPPKAVIVVLDGVSPSGVPSELLLDCGHLYIDVYICLRVWRLPLVLCHFCIVGVLWLDQSPLEVVVNTVYVQGMEIQLWGGHQVWSADVICQCLFLLCQCHECSPFSFYGQSLDCVFWLFHPKAGAAHGLPVVELATSFTPSLICWTRWLSSQVVKISTVSTPFILSLIALCRGLSCVWAMLQSIDCCNLTAPDIL